MNKDVIRHLIEQLPQPLNQSEMTVYAQIKAEGKAEGKTDLIIKGWLKGYPIHQLSALTDMPIADVKKIIEQYEQDKKGKSVDKKQN